MGKMGSRLTLPLHLLSRFLFATISSFKQVLIFKSLSACLGLLADREIHENKSGLGRIGLIFFWRTKFINDIRISSRKKVLMKFFLKTPHAA